MGPVVLNDTLASLEAALAGRTARTIDSPVRAAVAVVLRAERRDRTSVLLIERTTRDQDPWSGHMAFPGGRVQAEDEDPLSAAMREAREEIGLDLESSARLIGRLDDLRAIARGRELPLVISPFVFALTTDATASPDGVEAASVTWAPLEPMASGRLSGLYRITRPELGTIELPCFRVDDKVVWGLTHMMLLGLFQILGSGER